MVVKEQQRAFGGAGAFFATAAAGALDDAPRFGAGEALLAGVRPGVAAFGTTAGDAERGGASI